MTDAELIALARGTLAGVMKWGPDDKDRVAAARVALEATRRGTAVPAADSLESMSDEDLRVLAAQAEAALRSTTQ